MHARNAALVTLGNFEDDLDKVKDCDLIIEAIVERLDVKRALFEKLEKLAAPHAVIASNTSGYGSRTCSSAATSCSARTSWSRTSSTRRAT